MRNTERPRKEPRKERKGKKGIETEKERFSETERERKKTEKDEDRKV